MARCGERKPLLIDQTSSINRTRRLMRVADSEPDRRHRPGLKSRSALRTSRWDRGHHRAHLPQNALNSVSSVSCPASFGRARPQSPHAGRRSGRISCHRSRRPCLQATCFRQPRTAAGRRGQGCLTPRAPSAAPAGMKGWADAAGVTWTESAGRTIQRARRNPQANARGFSL